MKTEDLIKIPESIVIHGRAETRQIFINGAELKPLKSQMVWNHSPDGFNWGYGGSGPAQLSLAILLEFIEKQDAVMIHQQFKWDIISILPQNQNFKLDIKLRNVVKKLLQI